MGWIQGVQWGTVGPGRLPLKSKKINLTFYAAVENCYCFEKLKSPSKGSDAPSPAPTKSWIAP